MKPFLKLKLLVLLSFILFACDQGNKEQTPLSFKTVEWIDLLPKDDLDALLNPPAFIDNIEEGSDADISAPKIGNTTSPTVSEDRYQQALSSMRVIPEINGKAIRIPGFIVPLQFDEKQVVTDFFLVPYFGACMHLPPPPPNQIIHVSYPSGFEVKDIYKPFWISGKLHIETMKNELATSAYTMEMHQYEEYNEPPQAQY